MSLEAKIAELTTAVQVLTEVMTSGGTPTVNGKPNASSKVPSKATKAEAEPEDNETPPPAFLKKEVAATKAAAKTPAKAAAPAKGDAYAPVKKAILDAIAAGHRKSISDMLAEYDAKTGQDLTPDVYDEVLEKIGVITGGEVDLA